MSITARVPGRQILRRGLSWLADQPLTVVLAASIALRLAIVLAAGVSPGEWRRVREPDSFKYERLAEELLASGRFEYANQSEIERAPGYPFFLACCRWLSPATALVIGLQVGVAAIGVAIVDRLGLALGFERNEARLASWLIALEPISALYAGKLLTETLFVTFLLAGLLGLVRYLGGASFWRLAFAGAAFAAAMFVRPIAYFLPVVLFVVLMAYGLRKVARPSRWVAPILFFLVAMAPAAAWQIRNWLVADYSGFSTIATTNAYFWEAAATLAQVERKTTAAKQAELGYGDERAYSEIHPEQQDWPRQRILAFQASEARRIAIENPGAFLGVEAKGIARTLADPGTNAWLDYYGVLPEEDLGTRSEKERSLWRRIRDAAARPTTALPHAALSLILFLYYALAAVGAVRLGRMVRSLEGASRGSLIWPLIFMTITVAYFVLLSGGEAGNHRLRLPLAPILAILAAKGLAPRAAGKNAEPHPTTRSG